MKFRLRGISCCSALPLSLLTESGNVRICGRVPCHLAYLSHSCIACSNSSAVSLLFSSLYLADRRCAHMCLTPGPSFPSIDQIITFEFVHTCIEWLGLRLTVHVRMYVRR